MDEREKKTVAALVKMVAQYLDAGNDLIDTSSMSAGEEAIQALAAYGLVEIVNPRFGRWTSRGQDLLATLRRGHPA